MVTDLETTREIAKATKAVAETTGKAIDAGRDTGSFIAKFLAAPLEQGLGIFADKLAYMRWERQQRMMSQAKKVSAELGLGEPNRAIPMKIALPLFQGAFIEEDDDLQDRWVRLLLNAAYAEYNQNIQRVHVEILSQLSAVEARILDKIYAFPFDSTKHQGVATVRLPDEAELILIGDNGNMPEPLDGVCLALANLKRIGCITLPTTWGGSEFFGTVNPTRLGRDFVAACQTPRPNRTQAK